MKLVTGDFLKVDIFWWTFCWAEGLELGHFEGFSVENSELFGYVLNHWHFLKVQFNPKKDFFLCLTT